MQPTQPTQPNTRAVGVPTLLGVRARVALRLPQLLVCGAVVVASLLPHRSVVAVDLVSDIAYDSPGGFGTVLDLYTPTGGPISGFPTLLYIHGGAWSAGDKLSTAVLSQKLAAVGFSVATCNYTLSTQLSPSFPQAVHDVKAVVRWIRTDGVGLHGLSPQIVAFGTSAGGHLAMMLGTTAGMPFFEPQPPPPGGYRVDSTISFWGPADLVTLGEGGLGSAPSMIAFLGEALTPASQDLWALASPITHLDSTDPPLALYQGTTDLLVPFSQATQMQDAAEQAELMSWFFPFVGGHGGAPDLGGSDGATLRMQQIIPSMLAGDPLGNTALTAWGLIDGRLVSGNFVSLFNSDNNSMVLENSVDAVLTLDLSAETGLPASSTMDFTIESSVDAPTGLVAVELMDVATNVFAQVGEVSVVSGVTTQVLKGIELRGYVDPLGNIELRLRFTALGGAGVLPLSATIDNISITTFAGAPAIPAVSGWSLVVLLLLVGAAATVVLRVRKVPQERYICAD